MNEPRQQGGVAASGGNRPRAREDVVFRSVSDEWLLYDPRTQDLHVLNVTAAGIWTCCDGTMSLDQIARHVADHLDGAPDVSIVRADVETTVAKFRADGLLA